MVGRHFNFSLLRALCAIGASGLLASCSLDVSIDDLDPIPTLTAANTTVTEGGAGLVTLTLSKPAPKRVVVSYISEDGKATAPADYTSIAGIITIESGASSATLNIGSTQDAWYEGQEFYTLRFGAISGVTLSSVLQAGITVSIDDDESVPKVYIVDTSATEGAAIDFLVSLDVASQPEVSFDYQSFDGSAFVAKSDYTAAVGRLTFGPA